MEGEEPGKDLTVHQIKIPSSTIKDLPDDALLHIFSFLPFQDAVQASSICKRFQPPLWPRLPSLTFDQCLFKPQRICLIPTSSLYSGLFADFIDRALTLYQCSELPRLSVRFVYIEPSHYSHVHSWIRFAVSHNVQELDLHFGSKPPHRGFRYNFPLSLLSGSSIKILKLCCCNFCPPSTGISFQSLHALTLEHILLSEDTVPHIISGCPSLETLVLDHCDTNRHFKIHSEKLKNLSIMHYYNYCSNTSVEICTPNLATLKCVDYFAGKFYFKDVSALVAAEILFSHTLDHSEEWGRIVLSLGHVRSLVMQNWWMLLQLLEDNVIKRTLFSNLRYLDVFSDFTEVEILRVADLLKQSPILETVVIHQTSTTPDNYISQFEDKYWDEIFTGSLLKLKKVKIEHFSAKENELQLVKSILKFGVILEKVILIPNSNENVSDVLMKVYGALRSRPSSLPHVDIVLQQ